MRILTRYVLREFLIPLVCCLVGFISIYVLFELFGSFSRILEAKLPFGQVVLYFCGYIAPYFHYLAPAALMLATLYTMWMFCRHSELVAMRASGVSFLAIVKPVLSVAFVVALGVVWVNERFVPAKAQWAALMKSHRFDRDRVGEEENLSFRNADENRTWTVKSLGNAEGTLLNDIIVTVQRPDGTRALTVESSRAEYLDGEWWFHAPSVQHHDAKGREIATPTPGADALTFRCFDDFGERPSDFMMQNRPWRFNSVRDRLRYLRTHPNLEPAKRNDLTYDVWAQAMAPWACLIITLFAIPAGIASGRQSVFKGILGALGLFFAFYGSTIVCMIVPKSSLFPPVVAAILPYVVFLALGIRAFWRQR